MSATTKEALDTAIAAHVADEGEAPGSIITSWALIVSHSNADDFDAEQTSYFAEYGDRQPFHVSLGLVHHHRRVLETGDED